MRKLMRHWSLDLHFITGMMLGLEFPSGGIIFNDEKNAEAAIIHFVIVVDLLILRLMFVSYSEYE